ncbi:carboxylesterase/lipase family protein [Novosphingobium acidiphilum]|uniref:carboxylesterase/lipase family protein n=1 Tax=Novosphingobium acidiphilum TaxID=505248 RepID=UPI000A0175ED|nr:carboxylesterase family protein [Novosphingobium acidiphilum]
MNRPNRSARWRAAILALVLAVPNIAATEPPARITVGKAHLHGLALAGGVSAFLGIPYANAPTGARRWHVSTQARLSGEVDATHYGAACPQTEATAGWYRRLAVAMGSDGDVVPPGPTQSENCLFLNVWTPGAKVPAGKRLPVMVWVHGGSNTSGYSQEADYRGARLAARGVVVVTINYRLGALGFFAHPAVSDVSAGRQGLSDQITALRWVRDNIAAFGGDAARVTLFGESAGGTDIAALMHMPVAKGLFARAVIESGFLRADGMATPAAAAKAAADLFVHDETAATLAQRSAADLVHVQTERGKGRFVSPLVPPKPAFRVPLLIGTNADEFRLYLPSDPATRGAGEASTLLAMPNAGDVAHLLQHLSNDPAMRADLLASAPIFHCPAVRMAAATAAGGLGAWVYRFDRVRPGHHGFGAYHGAEIPYVFGTGAAWLPAEAADRALSDTMMRYWVNFARGGDPNGPGLPHWPRWGNTAVDAAAVPMMHFGSTVRVVPAADLALCPFFPGDL